MNKPKIEHRNDGDFYLKCYDSFEVVQSNYTATNEIVFHFNGKWKDDCLGYYDVAIFKVKMKQQNPF